jgi:hypothetical protein
VVPELLVPAVVVVVSAVAVDLLLAIAMHLMPHRWLVSPGTGLARRPVKKQSLLAVLAEL